MKLNEAGTLAEKYWAQIPNHFPFVELGNFVIMPNHVHGILIIDKNAMVDHNNSGQFLVCPLDTPKLGVSPSNTEMKHSETPNTNVASLQMFVIETPNLGVSTKSSAGHNEHWKPGTIGVIVNQYKRVCTINLRKTISYFAWQSRFHDHIIRNASSFEIIQDYIASNPKNWEKDQFYF